MKISNIETPKVCSEEIYIQSNSKKLLNLLNPSSSAYQEFAEANITLISAGRNILEAKTLNSLATLIKIVGKYLITSQPDAVKIVYNSYGQYKFNSNYYHPSYYTRVKIIKRPTCYYIGDVNASNISEGRGIKLCKPSGIHVGYWFDDQLFSYGAIIEENGSLFIGWFTDGKRSDRFTERRLNGDRFIHYYCSGELEVTLTYNKAYKSFFGVNLNGENIIEFSNGDIYQGKVKDNKMHGKGMLMKQDENRQIHKIYGIWQFGIYLGKDPNIEISEVEMGLYLGNIFDALNIRKLKDLNIKNIVQILDHDNMCTKHDGINYLFFPLKDGCEESLITIIRPALDFISKKLNAGESVLVHCYAGKSRSCSIVVAYIMDKYKASYQDALQFVQAARPTANPNKAFKNLLKNDFYKSILND